MDWLARLEADGRITSFGADRLVAGGWTVTWARGCEPNGLEAPTLADAIRLVIETEDAADICEAEDAKRRREHDAAIEAATNEPSFRGER